MRGRTVIWKLQQHDGGGVFFKIVAPKLYSNTYFFLYYLMKLYIIIFIYLLLLYLY